MLFKLLILNPNAVLYNFIAWKQLGINDISVGVQTFDMHNILSKQIIYSFVVHPFILSK